MQELLNLAKEYGFQGLTAFGLAWFILYMYRLHHKERTELYERHKAERSEWYAKQEKQADKLADKLETIILGIHSNRRND